MKYEDAIIFAMKVHEGQTRRDGTPYIYHPLRVASKLTCTELKIAAVLHDVVEDTEVTLDEIIEKFDYWTADCVDALTRREGESYSAFIDRVVEHGVAHLIKTQDILDNSGSHSTASQLARYKLALIKMGTWSELTKEEQARFGE